MTDSSVLLPNVQSLPNDCLFNLKPSSMRARQIRVSVPPINKSTFSPQDTMIFTISGGRRNTYLDPASSYIRYTVQNNDATAGNFIFFDATGASVINRLDVFHGSNLLDSIQSYNQLYSYLLDVQCNSATAQGLSSCYGTSSGITTQRAGATIAIGGRSTVCMPLLGCIGAGSDKFIPVGAMSDDLRIEVSLEANLVGMVWTATTTTVPWTIINAELELCYIEVSDEAENYIRSITPYDRPLYLHSNTWRHYTSTIPANQTGSYSTLVPMRFASAKSVVLCPRRTTEISNALAYSLSSRANPQISSYFWRVGSSIIPNKPVNLDNANTTGNYSEAFAELLRAWHSLNNLYISTQLNQPYYNVGDIALTNTNVVAINTGANSYKNGFVIAQELESFSNKTDVLLSGMNTLSSNVFFEANLATTAPATAYTLDFFTNFDQILVLENGLFTARF
jgi:hypothetical protein